jgi:hypothetical protein
MARAAKNPNLEGATRLPWDKEGALPIPSGAPKARRAGAPVRGTASDRPRPATGRSTPPAHEEYPGPQTASTGEHVEPGAPRPVRRRGQ